VLSVVAENQFIAARNELELARVEAGAEAEPELPNTPEPPQPGDVMWSTRRTPGRLVVIRTEATSTDAQSEMEEDMAVMLRILDKAVDRADRGDGSPKAMGIPLVAGAGGGGVVRGLFIEGQGPVFLLNVRFPLVPGPKAAPEEKPKGDTESEWEDTRRELKNPQSEWTGKFGTAGLQYQNYVNAANPDRPYDNERVEQLKTRLLESLRNATNIRNLKPDDTVTVSVFGTTAGAGGAVRIATPTKRSGAAPSPRFEHRLAGIVDSRGSSGGAKGSILTLRARKSDIDDYAKGKLDAGQFLRKASIAAYTGESPAAGGAFSFSF
jgi:hypothetical protein